MQNNIIKLMKMVQNIGVIFNLTMSMSSHKSLQFNDLQIIIMEMLDVFVVIVIRTLAITLFFPLLFLALTIVMHCFID